MNNETLKKTFLDSLITLDDECDLSLSDFNPEQLSAFASRAGSLCQTIERYIYSEPRLREFFETHKTYGSCSIEEINFNEDGITIHIREDGCHCCPHSSWDQTIDPDWLLGGGWQKEAKKIETAKKAKETKERNDKARKAAEAVVRKEEKDREEFERLSEKFGSEA